MSLKKGNIDPLAIWYLYFCVKNQHSITKFIIELLMTYNDNDN
jgi:hypothetical protein